MKDLNFSSSITFSGKTKKNRRLFDTFWKYNVAIGNIPSHDLKDLPKSTRHSLKNKDPNSFRQIHGFHFKQADLDLEKEAFSFSMRFVQSKVFQKSVIAVLKVKRCLLLIQSLPKKLRNSIQTKEKIVHTISRVKEQIGFDRVLRMFRISKSTFYNWHFQVRFQCNSSLEKLCYKRFSGQFSKQEVLTLKKLLLEKAALFWPLSAIWGYARKNDILHCSLSSFYKWSRAIHPDLFSNRFKKQKKQGFNTSRPNEVWHCDVTQFVTKDNVKSFIYILIDNFSKMILNFKVDSVVHSSVCASLIEEAVDKYQTSFSKLTMTDLFPLINLNLSKDSSFVHLMTDGGPENKGELEKVIFLKNLPINKITAGKEVTFSNSPIEAINKIVKYQRLHCQDILNRETLEKILNEWIPIYNQERPNRAGRYLLTPKEIYDGKTIDSTLLREQSKYAKKQRFHFNRATSCGVC
ncbi:DDE-type integrase/transposase/recombinase [Leptospira interrogans]|uniref:DDE-type integrase/transposase/recombinase n=1 Tax=Leptospira interrogans TaxID=173 RepID=UPI000773CDF4|nr:DDE-type integrase/transposase/recombinase [Leptospira interrogans]